LFLFSTYSRHRNLLILLILLVAFPLEICSFHVVPSEEVSTWERWDEGLPAIAPVLTLAAAPEQPDGLYAGTYSLPGLWRSADAGETWTRAGQAEEPGPDQHALFTLLWNSGRQRWSAGTAGGLFFRPADSPQWQPVAELDGSIFSLALDIGGRLYAIQADEGLYRREADGRWVQLRREPRALTVGVSSSEQHIFLGTAGRGLWISHDGGENWLEAPDLREKYISTLLIDPQDGQRLYAGSSRGVYRSEDTGFTWQAVPELAERAYTFVVSPDGSVLVGLEGRVARSQDAGQTWAFVTQGLHPQMPIFDLIAVRQVDSYLLYAATRDGVYRSADQGQTWQRRSKGVGGIEVESLTWDGVGGMIAATPLGLYRRSPGEARWQPTASDFKYKRFYDVSSDPSSGTVYAGMQSGLLQSTDRGQTWQEVMSDLTSHGIPGVMVDPEDPNRLFIRLAFERIYESYDGGQTWQARWAGMETHHEVLAMARTSTGELWAGTQEGLFLWDFQEQQWQREPLPSPNQSIFAIAFDPDSKTTYVGATAGLWRRQASSDWQRCAAETIPHTVTALVTLPDGHIYAGTRYAGLFHSCDRGDNWHRVSSLPHTVTVKALLVDTDDEMVYVATDRGLFRGSETYCVVAEPTVWGKAWPGWDRLISSVRRSLKSVLPPHGSFPPVQPFPAVHTLRANDDILRQARKIGFGAVIQVFSWQEIEPTRGEWHWEYPDFLLQAANFYDLDLIVRLDHPPTWAGQTSGGQSNETNIPFDVEAYLRFVETVAQRYEGRIRGYVVWNEPNLAAEWGGPPDPEGYTRLLQRSYEVIRQQDPTALVISAGLSPTNAQPDSAEQNNQAMDDRLFLEKMYQAGARPFFDALGVHPYGFVYPPDDPPGAHDGLNLNRILELRAIMKTYGDGAKPVWATEIGWTTHGAGEHSWLTVTPAEQADYLKRAWEKVSAEFPWLHLFTVWNLSQGLPEQDEKAGYSLLDGDGRPKPAYGALHEAFAATDLGQQRSVLTKLLNRVSADSPPIFILARDEEVHLGDSE